MCKWQGVAKFRFLKRKFIAKKFKVDFLATMSIMFLYAPPT